MTTARYRLLAVLAVMVGALFSTAGVAFADGQAVERQGTGSAYVRLAHLSPDTPDVDVYLASVTDPDLSFIVPGVGYGAVSDYRSLPVGIYTVAMREAGAPADSPPVIATTLSTEAGAAYTVAGTGHYTDLGLRVLSDDLSAPAPGEARVRVVNGAASAPRVDIGLVGPGGPQQLATGVEFATTTGYRSVPAGAWTLRVDVPGPAGPVEVPVTVPENSVQSVLLLDGPEGIVAELHADSVGAATVPLGSVATGRGGAPGDPAVPGGAAAGLAAAVLGA
ncbi:MAG: DUF4397 domain-containing protein, partial [Pseudonocardia sp.]|nr:DUF4397 domain-containing protein [Pseudonocardia sp.]